MTSYPPIKTDDGAEAFAETNALLLQLLREAQEHNGRVLTELKLLNARFEAMAETHINEVDLEK